jgi:mono/diheme cytochrome c family protein
MIAFLSLISPTSLAQNGSNASSGSTLSAGFKFAEKGGEELYVNICQGCHMPDGKGATGAGAYPSIAGNETLKASGYMLDVVVNGEASDAAVWRHDGRRSGGRCGKLCADAL